MLEPKMFQVAFGYNIMSNVDSAIPPQYSWA